MPDVTVVLNQTLNGQQVRNVTVWNNFREPEPDVQEFADAIRAGFLSNVASRMVNSWTLDSIDVIYNDQPPVYSINVPFTLGPLVGTSADRSLANQTALLVSTQYQGAPPNRGRIYFAGCSNLQLEDEGLWQAGTLNAFQLMVEAWKDGITTTDNAFFLRIARRDAQGIITVSSGVSTCIARPVPATQRSRRIGSGI